MQKYLTVVYTINDEAAFADEHAAIMEKFQESKGKPWAITAMSIDHEIGRLSLIEEAVDRREWDMVEDIIGHPAIGQFETLADFEAAEA